MEDVERVDMRPRESLECARDYGNDQLTNYGKASTPLLVAFHVIHNNNVVSQSYKTRCYHQNTSFILLQLCRSDMGME